MWEKTERKSLTIRWQPRANSPLGNVVSWLNSMNPRDKREKLEHLCLMILLPYALEANEKTEEEIERCYWETHERLHQHLFIMRQTLGIKTPIPSGSYSGINIDANQQSEATASKVQNNSEGGFEDIDLIFNVSQ